MGDAMRLEGAKAMFRQDHDEGWDQGEVRTKVIYLNNTDAALEACHFERMREALVTIANVGSGEAQRTALETLRAVDND